MCPFPCLMTIDPPSGSGERSTASAPSTGIHSISTCAVHSLAATNTVVGRCTERISRLAVPSLSATAWTQVLSGNNTKACAPASGAPSRRTVMTPAPLPEDGSATVFVPQTPELLAARERAASPDCSCLLGLTVGASFPRDWIFDRRPWPHLAHGRTMVPTHRLTAGIIAATTAPTAAATTDVTSAGSSSIARTLFGLCRPSAPSGVGLTRGKSSHDLNLPGLRVGSGVEIARSVVCPWVSRGLLARLRAGVEQASNVRFDFYRDSYRIRWHEPIRADTGNPRNPHLAAHSDTG